MSKLLDFAERCLARCWERVETSCSVDLLSLGIFRILWGFFVLLLAAPHLSFVGRVPQAFFQPPVLSIANFFDGFPPYPVMLGADLVILTLVTAILLGIRARVSTLALCGVMILANSFAYSFGKIDHGIMIWAVAFCLAFAGWGCQYALVPDRTPDRRVTARALGTAGVLIAFALFSAGYEKALRWIDFDLSTGGFMAWFYSGYYTLDRTDLLAPLVLKVPPQWFEIADYFAAVFEITAIFFLLLGRCAWRLWLLIAALFHMTNVLLLNIPFQSHVMVYLPFVALAPLMGVRGDDEPSARRISLWVAVAAVSLLAFHVFRKLSGAGGQIVLMWDDPDRDSAELYTALALWAGCALLIGMDLLRLRRANAC